MKRMHIHVGVDDLDQSIRFYSALFGTPPTKTKPDYAKWMVDDPRINFAISVRAGRTGVDHLGLQVDEDDELEELRERFRKADLSVFDEGETVCCYAQSDKSWVQDPSGVAWETFRTMADAEIYSRSQVMKDKARDEPGIKTKHECCAPLANTMKCCK